ncbi:hypothetical protein [Cupriavidus basilensis]|uniref:hypothetical protein n=1 Tax=Cupriavidus basilensis TaxID=68895 RepID=UPI00157B3D96|nr:hypothetical protein [Cupriavidus basilensis]
MISPLVGGALGIETNADGANSLNQAVVIGASMLAGGALANALGQNGISAAGAAQNEAANNYLSPKQAGALERAKAQCAAGDASQRTLRDQLLSLDATSRKQLNALADACANGSAVACQTAQSAVSLLNKIAKGDVKDCGGGVVDCLAAYQPSAQELSGVAAKLPGAGSGAVVPTADPISAAALIRLGLVNPGAGLTAGVSAGLGEYVNQVLFGDGSVNYERIANTAVLGGATAPFGGIFSGYAGTALIGGSSNAAATAYNNSQTGAHDSALAAMVVGMTFGAGSKGLADGGGLFLSRAMNFTRQYDPALGVLLQAPGGRLVATPIQSIVPSTFRDFGTGLLPATGGVVRLPEAPRNDGK